MVVDVAGYALDLKYVLFPLVCALIGWLTNYIAVKMLFHPRRPRSLFFCEIQGIFPKRQAALAENLGHVVETGLLSHEDIRRIIEAPAFHEQMRTVAAGRIDVFLDEKLGTLHPMVKMALAGEMRQKLRGMLLNELDALLPEVIETASRSLEERLVVRELVREKVANFPPERIEEMLFSILRKEFRFIELVGGVLGFFIGVAQSAAFYFLG